MPHNVTEILRSENMITTSALSANLSLISPTRGPTMTLGGHRQSIFKFYDHLINFYSYFQVKEKWYKMLNNNLTQFGNIILSKYVIE